MSMRFQLRKLFWKMGYDVTGLDPSVSILARNREIFQSYKIGLVIDVGANTGQFAEYVRKSIGFRGPIISFEPLTSAYSVLKQNALHDKQWQVFNYGLGASDGTVSLNVAKNSQSSSFLKMLPSHREASPGSHYVGTEMVSVKTLDSIFDTLYKKGDSVFLKLDTQGFEPKVLEGGKRSLVKIDTIQIEMSLIRLYSGEQPFHQMYKFLASKGYDLVSIEPIYFGEVPGRVLQVDGIFHRF